MWTRSNWRHMPSNFCHVTKLQCVAFCRVVKCGSAMRQKLLGVSCKINHIHIKKEFFANYVSLYKNWGMRNTFASYAALKITSHYSWQQISVYQTFDDTNILTIKFSCHKTFCNKPQNAGTMPKPRRIDVYTTYSICRATKPYFVAFCQTA